MAAAAGGRRRWAVGGGVRRVGEGLYPTQLLTSYNIADASLKLRRPYLHFDGPID
ncbi:hypothetical protein F511_28742 [Dorcoceras hygrometricum]|uniref:Uncharacterized protein n=1 Tax=Dorcoceras hygrometricum TaxID=472368 RepID=A0A2Z7A485_9LAMI|nr:hypothetical protein F511_28742 [Dorcoceras hygrometricum]